MSHPHPYNLRNREQSPSYTEKEDYDIDQAYDDSGDEDSREEYDKRPSRHQNQNYSHASMSDYNQSDNSHLSSTASDSFSFRDFSGRSPSTGSAGQKLYPDLSPHNKDHNRSPQHSPVHKRRGIHRPAEFESRSPREETLRGRHQHKPAPAGSKPQRHSEEATSFGLMLKVCLLFGIAVIMIYFAFVMHGEPTPAADSEKKVSHFDTFSKQVDSLQKVFPTQNSRFWRVVKSCTRHVFDPEQATYPAILLMVGEKKHASYASRIADSIQETFTSVKLQSSSPAERASLNLTASAATLGVDEQKLLLDDWLKEKLDNNKVAVVVNHLETLLPEAALLLHGYCDGDNAPYKDVMLIFGLFFNKRMDSSQVAEDALRRLWMSEFMKDKIGALLSRVANNIVLVEGPQM